MICIELAYVNTKHPDFSEATLVHKVLTDGSGVDADMKKLNLRQQQQQAAVQQDPRVRYRVLCRIWEGEGKYDENLGPNKSRRGAWPLTRV